MACDAKASNIIIGYKRHSPFNLHQHLKMTFMGNHQDLSFRVHRTVEYCTKSNRSASNNETDVTTASSGLLSNCWAGSTVHGSSACLGPLSNSGSYQPLSLVNVNGLEVDKVIGTIDLVTELVEKVAEMVEKAANRLAESLPEGGKLQKAVLVVGKIAKIIREDAHAADEIIHKIEDVENNIEREIKAITKAMGNQDHKREIKQLAAEVIELEETTKIIEALTSDDEQAN
ncbi:hypothetical protein Syun_005606 [Stephania yunnanensis]|uniref:Uncharacterized protein n=1 Tax=Stephania yunnanensis TaxID=152371 RepID=A0AAP0L8R6_9MAGN